MRLEQARAVGLGPERLSTIARPTVGDLTADAVQLGSQLVPLSAQLVGLGRFRDYRSGEDGDG